MRKNLFQQQRAYNFYFFVFLLVGCTSVKFTSTIPGQPKAKYYTFSKNKDNTSSSLVDTSVIYVYENDLVRTYKTGKAEKVYTYMYLIFKSNGLAFYSNDSRDAFNQFNIYTIGGQYCFYKVEGNQLQLELFDFNHKKFTIMYGSLLPDKVYFYKDKLRIVGGGASKQNMHFIKTSIKHTRQLVWPE